MAQTYAERQALMARLLTETAKQYEGINASLQRFAVEEISRVRDGLTLQLMQQANSDNVIAKTRIVSLLSDLDAYENKLNTVGMSALTKIITQSADFGLAGGLQAIQEGLSGLEGAVVNGGAFDRISERVLQYVVNRFGNDGLVLSNRVWQLAKTQRNSLEQVIRSGIIRGESVNSIVANVRKVHDNETWKIRRLVITEGNVAYRTANAYTAQASNVVKALRIHRGEADSPTHRCTEMEHIDRYGLGEGIYLATDAEVLNPHPNCTSYTTYVLT
jgi:hypothetical protein